MVIKMKRHLSTALLAAFSAASIASCSESDPSVDRGEVSERTIYEPTTSRPTAAPAPTTDVNVSALVDGDELLDALYAPRRYDPLWVEFTDDSVRLSESGRELVDILKHTSDEHALDFDLSVDVDLSSTSTAMQSEVALTRGLVAYAKAMGIGKRGVAPTDDDQNELPRDIDGAVQAKLTPLFDGSLPAARIEDQIEPPYAQYDQLVEAYGLYADVEASGGFVDVPSEVVDFDLDNYSRHMPIIAERLQQEGYWDDRGADFGENLVRSINAFQRAHRLAETGWVDRETLEAMSESAGSKRKKIRRAMKHWRTTRIGDDSHYVWVNIPDYHAEVWREGERNMRFKVIVGAGEKVYNHRLGKKVMQGQTPRFSDQIEIIEYNPYWWIPDNIAATEYAPVQRRDPSFYRRQGYEWAKTVGGLTKLRQKPGPDNALGQVKFLFPNEHHVYMHDTSQRELFDKDVRNLSHGCVRVHEPFDFAEYLMLHDGKATPTNVDEVIAGYTAKDEPTAVELDNPVPIHIEYVTVRVDDEGFVRWLPDPYDLED